MGRIGLFGLMASGLLCACTSAPADDGSGGAAGASSASTGGLAGAGGGDATSSGSGSAGGGGAPACLADPGSWSGQCHDASRFAAHVVEACFGPGAGFGQESFPQIVYGPPKGGGDANGALDVLTLGNGGSITLAFDNAIVDGPGPDFTVFENPFLVGGDPKMPYAELATVAVSDDGITWTSFPCSASTFPYGSCAGWHPVYANPDGGADPLDPAVSGGDAFDLADIGVEHARFVRITDRADLPTAFDLDAVAIVNAECP